jgi:hypothetical protein
MTYAKAKKILSVYLMQTYKYYKSLSFYKSLKVNKKKKPSKDEEDKQNKGRYENIFTLFSENLFFCLLQRFIQFLIVSR